MGIESIRYSLVFKLLHNFRQFLRHGQTNPSGVLDDGDAFIGAIEEDDSGAKDAAASYHMDIEDIRHAYQGKDKHLLADALEADGGGQVSLHDGTKHSCHIVRSYKRHQCVHEAVETAEILAKSRSLFRPKNQRRCAASDN